MMSKFKNWLTGSTNSLRKWLGQSSTIRSDVTELTLVTPGVSFGKTKRLEGYPWLPTPYHDQLQWLEAPPNLVVIHSGSRSPKVAEYLHRMPDKRKVAVHFAWHGGRQLFVQMAELNREGWHVGGSRFADVPERPNTFSYGIELPGPWAENPRSLKQKRRLRRLLHAIRPLCGSPCYLTAHEFIDYGKRDPGPGVDRGWFDGLGYTVIWEKCRYASLADF
jgi:hypothetical protein